MLPENVIFDPDLSEKVYIYKDRFHAGRVLASFMKRHGIDFDKVFAIPAGGVPVAIEVAKAYQKPLDLVIVKKVLYPWTTEAGFGAVAPDGRAVLGPAPLSEEEIKEQVRKALEKVLLREKVLRGGRPYEVPPRVVVIDDGIATGYTMIAAVEFLRDKGAEEVIAAAPTASLDGAIAVSKVADLVVVPNIRSGPYFAVAEAYQEWRDLSEEEVLELLSRYSSGSI
ncbi:phosphoribosyltransferase [Ignicoccus pacificus DSM 13166]|uniref:Phosphoribosyltransferase n=1 Tax=Ignicoccus pacificus DSM 13166 TaxID=940294 RepID=A0A977K9V6_9CREN|nr:phosphoribosyltransferase [Ignicoccus pacificus DSM 13166]